MLIKGRTFVVSGGCSGLGHATVRNLHAQGAYIAILDLDEPAGSQLVTDLDSDRAIFIATDISESSSIEAAIKHIATWLTATSAPLAGIICAAGVGNPGKLVSRSNKPLAMSAIDFVLNINLRGTLDLIRQMLPLMTQLPKTPEHERGVIVLVSSSAAYDGQAGQVAYAASKGGIRSMTLPLARDLSSYGIRVVSIAPSLFESNMTAMMSDKVRSGLERAMEFPARAGRPEEFADLVRHVIENVMLNGVTIRLDGAMRMPARL